MRASFLILAVAVWGCSPAVVPNPDGGGTGGGASGGAGGGSGVGGGSGTGGSSATGGGSGATGGGGSTGGGSGGGGTGVGGGSAGGGGGSGGDGGMCPGGCGLGRTCCPMTGGCVNTANDPHNCGDCGVVCSDPNPYCSGSCQPRPCAMDAGLCGNAICCGTQCCGEGQLCCEYEGSVSGFAECYTLDAGETTCPQGCAPLCQSDRNIKRDVLEVDERQVLERLSSIPYSTWSYSSDPTGARHLGPMAQDFHAAFGLGNSELNYEPIDAHGVSMASIKALYKLVQDQQRRLERLEAENAALKAGVCSP